MDKILEKISYIIETYESGAFKDLHVMHRELTCNMYYLSQEQVKAHAEWNKQYYLRIFRISLRLHKVMITGFFLSLGTARLQY